MYTSVFQTFTQLLTSKNKHGGSLGLPSKLQCLTHTGIATEATGAACLRQRRELRIGPSSRISMQVREPSSPAIQMLAVIRRSLVPCLLHAFRQPLLCSRGLTLYWFMAASSSASACCLSVSSMNSADAPLALSRRLDAATLPNDDDVEDKAPITLATFFWALKKVVRL